ncbi:uncharacterized protein LOC134163372 isoform X3 [Pezoporus occidentalis]|uniref:uncharacterized protein LOC134163372 isoform X3 n=1 Tax=Pezoporus occidentalis TaxID=407982 RepID=UPI002F908E8D
MVRVGRDVFSILIFMVVDLPHLCPAVTALPTSSPPQRVPSLPLPGVLQWQLAPITRSGQPGAGPGAALTSGAKVQLGDCTAGAGQLEPGPRSTMRLGLLCGLTAAAALMVVGRADHGDTKVTQRREGMSGVGRRRPHRPCSGCFSVLSEESRSMSWRDSEDDEGQPRRRERDRREDKEQAQPETPRHRPAAATGGTECPDGLANSKDGALAQPHTGREPRAQPTPGHALRQSGVPPAPPTGYK